MSELRDPLTEIQALVAKLNEIPVPSPRLVVVVVGGGVCPRPIAKAVEFGFLDGFRLIESPPMPLCRPTANEAAHNRMEQLRKRTGQDWRGRR